MKFSPAELKELDAMPAVLRKLLEAELASGNSLIEVGHSSPAPPAGVYFKLARPISTRPRFSGEGIVYYDRNSSIYSGEWTDAKRFYFLLEPPNPPPPEADMNAIREALRAKQDNYKYAGSTEILEEPREYVAHKPPPSQEPAPRKKPETALERFRASMVMDYERWHDGIGYDLSILKTAAPEELIEIEDFLVGRGVSDWRDVEALAALDSPRARVLLRNTLKKGKREHAKAVLSHAPHLASEDERTGTLVEALEQTDFYGGLTQALLEVESFHPPEIIDALLRGVLKRKGEHACHFAAMLMFVRGKAKSAFDWDFAALLSEIQHRRHGGASQTLS